MIALLLSFVLQSAHAEVGPSSLTLKTDLIHQDQGKRYSFKKDVIREAEFFEDGVICYITLNDTDSIAIPAVQENGEATQIPVLSYERQKSKNRTIIVTEPFTLSCTVSAVAIYYSPSVKTVQKELKHVFELQ
jgi:hypothetical protein